VHALGYRTDVVDSVTSGEAPDRLRDWIAQRTLWHKGFLLTHSAPLAIRLYAIAGVKRG
jgi:cellulose synthase/poly-beta-1,6-N-acetylglucosamine synthase-like glycosyltransferase